MIFFRNILVETYRKAILHKSFILKIVAAVATILLASLFIEIYGFGYKLQTLGKLDSGIFAINKTEIATSDFSLNDQGALISSTDNATIDLLTNGRYVQNLELSLAGNTDYKISVKYIDPKTNKEIVLESDVQKNMEKNGFNFLHLHFREKYMTYGI